MSLLRRIVPAFLRRYLGRLRFPYLFVLMALVLVGDLAVPDALPFVDEILLALASAILGSLRKRITKGEGTGDGGGAVGGGEGAGSGDPGRSAGPP